VIPAIVVILIHVIQFMEIAQKYRHHCNTPNSSMDVAAARAEYRQISREWHTFLGLGDAKATEAGPTIQQPLESAPPLKQTALPQAQTAPMAVPRGPSSGWELQLVA
jgi:hypothetical protein